MHGRIISMTKETLGTCKSDVKNDFNRAYFLDSLLLAGLVASAYAKLRARGVTGKVHFGSA